MTDDLDDFKRKLEAAIASRRWNFEGLEDPPPCPYCGRCVFCGPPCCQESADQIEFEKIRPTLINQARKRARRVFKRAHNRYVQGQRT